MHVSDYLLTSLRSFRIEGRGLSRPLRLPLEAASFVGRGILNKSRRKRGRRILAIHPGSGSQAKNWSPRNFAVVADWASERALLLISGPAQDN